MNVDVSGQSAVLTALQKHMEEVVHTFLDQRGEAVCELSEDRLSGRFGSQFSHYYFNEDMGKVVPRFEIKHRQTGRLTDSNTWHRTGNEVTIRNAATSTRTGEQYALRIAEIDWRELGRGGDAWTWAVMKDKEKLGNSTSIQSYFS